MGRVVRVRVVCSCSRGHPHDQISLKSRLGASLRRFDLERLGHHPQHTKHARLAQLWMERGPSRCPARKRQEKKQGRTYVRGLNLAPPSIHPSTRPTQRGVSQPAPNQSRLPNQRPWHPQPTPCGPRPRTPRTRIAQATLWRGRVEATSRVAPTSILALAGLLRGSRPPPKRQSRARPVKPRGNEHAGIGIRALAVGSTRVQPARVASQAGPSELIGERSPPLALGA